MDSNLQKEFILGAFIGGVVGAAAALMFTPMSGSKLRSKINNGAEYLGDMQPLKKIYKKVSNKASALTGKSGNIRHSTRKSAKVTAADTLKKATKKVASKAKAVKRSYVKKAEKVLAGKPHAKAHKKAHSAAHDHAAAPKKTRKPYTRKTKKETVAHTSAVA